MQFHARCVLAAAAAAAALIAAPDPAAAKGPKPMCLPAAVNGQGTGVGFQGSYYGRGRFHGITVMRINVPNPSVSIRSRSGKVHYRGPVRVGQYIALPEHWNLVWTGWGGKNHMNGICVQAQY